MRLAIRPEHIHLFDAETGRRLAAARMKDVVILGGPNGAGKTTAAARLLPQALGIVEFVNADEIARGLSPFNPEGSAIMAGRIMIERMRALVRDGRSFAFETTCSGRSHLRMLEECRDAGYRLTLVFLWLRSPELAVARVARRVAERRPFDPARHHLRRYRAGIHNMRIYLPAAHRVFIVDNSDGSGVLIAELQRGLSSCCSGPGSGQKLRMRRMTDFTPKEMRKSSLARSQNAARMREKVQTRHRPHVPPAKVRAAPSQTPDSAPEIVPSDARTLRPAIRDRGQAAE